MRKQSTVCTCLNCLPANSLAQLAQVAHQGAGHLQSYSACCWTAEHFDEVLLHSADV